MLRFQVTHRQLKQITEQLSEFLVSEESISLRHATQMVKLGLLPKAVLSALRGGSSSPHNDRTAPFSALDPLLREVCYRPPHSSSPSQLSEFSIAWSCS